MRTRREIVRRVARLDKSLVVDPYGHEASYLMQHMIADDWAKVGYPIAASAAGAWKPKPRDFRNVHNDLAAYLPQAWAKANEATNLNAERIISRLCAFLWLFLESETEINKLRYDTFYGKNALRVVSEQVGFPWSNHDNGVWKNVDGEAFSPYEVPPIELTLRYLCPLH